MTLKEWYEFNSPVSNISRAWFCLYPNGVFTAEKQIFSSSMLISDAVRLFGDLEVGSFGCIKEYSSGGSQLDFSLWEKPFEQETDNA